MQLHHENCLCSLSHAHCYMLNALCLSPLVHCTLAIASCPVPRVHCFVPITLGLPPLNLRLLPHAYCAITITHAPMINMLVALLLLDQAQSSLSLTHVLCLINNASSVHAHSLLPVNKYCSTLCI